MKLSRGLWRRTARTGDAAWRGHELVATNSKRHILDRAIQEEGGTYRFEFGISNIFAPIGDGIERSSHKPNRDNAKEQNHLMIRLHN